MEKSVPAVCAETTVWTSGTEKKTEVERMSRILLMLTLMQTKFRWHVNDVKEGNPLLAESRYDALSTKRLLKRSLRSEARLFRLALLFTKSFSRLYERKCFEANLGPFSSSYETPLKMTHSVAIQSSSSAGKPFVKRGWVENQVECVER